MPQFNVHPVEMEGIVQMQLVPGEKQNASEITGYRISIPDKHIFSQAALK